MIKEIENTEDFEDFIKSDISIIDFWAEFCSPGTEFEPVFKSVSEKFRNIKFARANFQDNSELSEKFWIDAVPCILIFKKGRLIDKILGYILEEELENKLRRL